MSTLGRGHGKGEGEGEREAKKTVGGGGDCVREDMNVANVIEQNALERAKWKGKIRAGDPI